MQYGLHNLSDTIEDKAKDRKWYGRSKLVGYLANDPDKMFLQPDWIVPEGAKITIYRVCMERNEVRMLPESMKRPLLLREGEMLLQNVMEDPIDRFVVNNSRPEISDTIMAKKNPSQIDNTGISTSTSTNQDKHKYPVSNGFQTSKKRKIHDVKPDVVDKKRIKNDR